MTDVERMKGESLDISEQRRKELKQLFPGVFTETTGVDGQPVESIDFERLKAELGTFSDVYEGRRERYGMEWPGKRDCMKLIQEPSRATLKPCREESVDFDTTQNLFIEGDNFEVLKLLQKAYYGKVKMIYIDPPYNTGKEFIYPDKYSESLETYLAYAGLVDDDGKKFSSNTATEGRFHTKWLNMMYPRLYLARNLLQEDGVIFISIDDNEVENLRRICNEVFGDENFVWKRRSGAMDAVLNASDDHEYVLCYAKQISALNGLPRTFERYSNPDEDFRGDWISDNLSAGKPGGDTYYAITDPETGFKYWPPVGRYWPYSRQTMARKIKEGRVLFPKCADGTPMLKRFRNEAKRDVLPVSTWIETPARNNQGQGTLVVPMNSSATKALKGLFGEKVFLYPKPVELVKGLISQGANKDSIILDFFAGSGSIAQAVIEANIDDEGSRQFLLVQLPEPLTESPTSTSFHFKSIADIGKERIRRTSLKIRGECEKHFDLDGKKDMDHGFKVLKLDQSNFQQWDMIPEGCNEDNLAQQLEIHIDHIDPSASQEEILYELLLKAGFMPTEQIKTLTLADKQVFSIAEGALLICLEEQLTHALIDAVADQEPMQFICLDKGFNSNDQLKANAVQTFKSRSQSAETEMVFKVV